VKALRILGAIGRATGRKLGTFRALKINNFFLIIALVAYSAGESGIEPASAYPFLLFLFAVLLFPLSSDPLDEVPRSRLALWPVTPRERAVLRAASLVLSPILWFVVLLLFFHRIRPGVASAFITLAILVQALSTTFRFAPQWNVRRYVPGWRGTIGMLMRSSLRQMLVSLDVYLALVLSLGAVLYRLLDAHPDPAAFPILAILIALAVGDYAQCLFGRDLGGSAITRYRLFPLGGTAVLLAKGAACLAITFLLTLPVQLTVGMTYAFTALAFGHHASVIHPAPLRAWRFSGSRVYIGVIQGIAGIVLAFGAAQRGALYLASSVILYCLSLAIYGRVWELRRAA